MLKEAFLPTSPNVTLDHNSGWGHEMGTGENWNISFLDHKHVRLMFIGALCSHPQEESTWNKENYFFKVLAGKSAQQKQVPKCFSCRNFSRQLYLPDYFGCGSANNQDLCAPRLSSLPLSFFDSQLQRSNCAVPQPRLSMLGRSTSLLLMSNFVLILPWYATPRTHVSSMTAHMQQLKCTMGVTCVLESYSWFLFFVDFPLGLFFSFLPWEDSGWGFWNTLKKSQNFREILSRCFPLVVAL